MIHPHTALGPEDLWETADNERLPRKSAVAAKIMRNTRKYYEQNRNDCKCIFCSLKGENKEHDELIDQIVIDYITNFKRDNPYQDQDYGDPYIDYMPPLNVLEEIMKYVYEDYDGYRRNEGAAANLTPLMKEMLNRGVAKSELDKILDKFKSQNEISWCDLEL